MPAPINRKPVFIVETFETLKAVSDSFRIRLMDEINLANDLGELRTVKELATALETTPHKLYYHMHMLEEHGLILVAKTQIISGIIEKHYALSAMRIHIAEHLFNSGERSSERSTSAVGLFDSAASSTRSDFITYMESTKGERQHLATYAGRSAHFTQERVRLTSAQAADFLSRLNALTEEFSNLKESASSGESTVYNLMTVLIPALNQESGRALPDNQKDEK